MAYRVIKKTKAGFSIGKYDIYDIIKSFLVLLCVYLFVNRLMINFAVGFILFVMLSYVLIYLFITRSLNYFYINGIIIYKNLFILIRKIIYNKDNIYVSEFDVKLMPDEKNTFKVVDGKNVNYYAVYLMKDETTQYKNQANKDKIISNNYQMFRLEEDVKIKQIKVPVINDSIDTDFFSDKEEYQNYVMENKAFLEYIQESTTERVYVILESTNKQSLDKSKYILSHFDTYIECDEMMTSYVYFNYLNKFDNAVIENKYIMKDNKYYTNMSMVDLQDEVNDEWLLELSNNNDLMMVLDYKLINKVKAKKDINVSYSEKLTQSDDEKVNAIDQVLSEEEAMNLLDLGKDVAKNIERIFKVSIKLWFEADSLEELEEKIITTKLRLSNEDFQFRLNNYMLNKEITYLFYPEFRDSHMKDIESLTLTYGNLNDVDILNDKKGMVYLNSTNGYGIFNQFFKTHIRNSYSADVVGLKSSGKTTLVKKIAKDNIIIGNKVIILDLENENSKFVKNLGGVNISPSFESPFAINIMQVFIVDEDTSNISFTIERLVVLFEYFYDFTKTEEGILRDLLSNFYKASGITDKKVINNEIKQYPILEDFYNYVNVLDDEQYQSIVDEKSARLYADFYSQFKIATKIMFSKENKNFFSGSSDSINLDNNLINVELKTIVNQAQNSNIAKAYLDTIVYIFIVLAMNENREYNRARGIERNNISEKFNEARFLNLVIDEIHNLYNLSNENYLQIIARLRKQDAKYLTAITTVLQNASTYYAPKDNASNKQIALNEIWNNAMYHIVFKQNIISEELIDSLFGENSNIDESVRGKINSLLQGEFMLEYSNNVHFLKLERLEEEAKLYDNVGFIND